MASVEVAIACTVVAKVMICGAVGERVNCSVIVVSGSTITVVWMTLNSVERPMGGDAPDARKSVMFCVSVGARGGTLAPVSRRYSGERAEIWVIWPERGRE